MPMYSDDLIEEVRSRNDIVDVIGQYVRLEKRGSTYFGLCPFHNEKTGSFSVTPGKQMYYCFGCHAGGSVFTFLQQYENMSFVESVQFLADRAGINLPKAELTREDRIRADKKSRLMEVTKDAATYFYTLLRSKPGEYALSYFTNRGLGPETMKNFGLGYSDKKPNDLYLYLKNKGYEDELLKDSGLFTYDEARGVHDKFWNRAMFPIFDPNGKVIAFGGRVMGEGEPKYLNSPETMIFDKSHNLYALNIVRKTRRDYYILCEGYMDVISLHQAGFDNALASLGTALTAGHAGMLKRYAREKYIYISYDSDGAGQAAAFRAIPILRAAGLSCKVIDLAPYKDPDELIKAKGPEEYEKRVDRAENFFMFICKYLQKQYDLNDPDGQTKWHTAIAEHLVRDFSEEIERDNYLKAVSKEFEIDYGNLRKLVVSLAGKIESTRPSTNITNEQVVIKKQTGEDGLLKSQRLLLTWMSEDKKVYDSVRTYIAPIDFDVGIYRIVAEELYKQYEEGSLMPAKIVNMFDDESEQQQVAQIFNTEARGVETPNDRNKALQETVCRIKEHSIEEKQKSGQLGFAQLIESKKQMEALKKMRFSIQ